VGISRDPHALDPARLQRLSARGLMKPVTAQRLAEAYTFLRRVEHRIQYLDDQQTHLLPGADADLAWIARSLGLACEADACELLDRLGQTRELVATEFDALLHDGQPTPGTSNGNGCKACGAGPLAIDDEAFSNACRRAGRAHPSLGQARARAVVARRQQAAPGTPGATRGRRRRGRAPWRRRPLRFIDWMEPLLRRESYLALLVERPEVQQRLLRLLGLARWPMRYLMLHPGVIDELADARLLHGRFDRRRSSPRWTNATPRGTAPAKPARRPCSIRCAAPTTPRSSAPWCATSRATSASSRSPTTCRR
jgi:glutamate-ammonia-ligase adenylyltransferase